MTLEEIYYIGQTIAVVAILGSLGAIWDAFVFYRPDADHGGAQLNASPAGVGESGEDTA